MVSPRFLRPHTIKVVNVLEEKDYKEQTKETIIENVKVSGMHSNVVLASNTGNKRVKDGIKITIDCRDVKEPYVRANDWEEEVGWSIRLDKDKVFFGNQELKIIGFEEKDPFGRVEFVELVCQRK